MNLREKLIELANDFPPNVRLNTTGIILIVTTDEQQHQAIVAPPGQAPAIYGLEQLVGATAPMAQRALQAAAAAGAQQAKPKLQS